MSILQEYEQEGWKKGLAEGTEQVAKNLLSEGAEATWVAKVTQLSLAL